MKTAFRAFLIVIGCLAIVDTLLVSSLSNMNLGVIMPAIIGAPLLILGVFYTRIAAFFARSLFGRVVKWCIIGAYALFGAIFIVTTAMVVRAANVEADSGADAIIVPGAGLHGDVVSLILKNRLDTAAEYLLANPDAICIVSGGQGEGETVTEAYAMKRYLVEMHGIEAEMIVEEGESVSTYENFAFSKRIIDDRFSHEAEVVFVTTDFHVFRAGHTAAKAGVTATGIASPGVWYIALNNYLRECVAIVLNLVIKA